MSRTRTLADLRADVRIAADIEGQDATTGRHPDAELTRFINQANLGLQRMVSEVGDMFYAVRWTGITAAGVPNLTLLQWTLGQTPTSSPYNVIEHFGASVNMGGSVTGGSSGPATVSGGIMRELSRNAFGVRHFMSGYHGIPEGFFARGPSEIVLTPTPDAVYYVEGWVLPVPPDLSADTDTLDGIFGAEDWVVFDAAVRVLLKDGLSEEAAAAASERDKVGDQILETCAKRVHLPRRRLDTWGRRRNLRQYQQWWRRQ